MPPFLSDTDSNVEAKSKVNFSKKSNVRIKIGKSKGLSEWRINAFLCCFHSYECVYGFNSLIPLEPFCIPYKSFRFDTI